MARAAWGRRCRRVGSRQLDLYGAGFALAPGRRRRRQTKTLRPKLGQWRHLRHHRTPSRFPPSGHRQACQAASCEAEAGSRGRDERAGGAGVALCQRRSECRRGACRRARHGEPDDGLRTGSQCAGGNAAGRNPRSGAGARRGRCMPMAARPINIICAATISITAPTWRSLSTTCRSICRRHAHGQGYTDLNWLMPETVSSLDIRKGPYFADVGDFATAGSLFINLRDSVDKNIVAVTLGSFDYQRYFTMGSAKLGGGSLLYAGETNLLQRSVGDAGRHAEVYRAVALQPGYGDRRLFRHRRWLIRTPGLRPSRCRCAPSRPDRSDSTAKSIRPTAATPAAIRCRRAWRKPTTTDRGRPMPISSNTKWTSTTITLGFSPIRSMAISSISTTTASTAAPAPRALSTARCSAGRPKPCFGFQSRYDDIDIVLNNTRRSGNSCPPFSTTMSTRAMSASMPRTPCIGPTGCGPRSAGAAIILPPR